MKTLLDKKQMVFKRINLGVDQLDFGKNQEKVERCNVLRVLHIGSPNGLYGAERWILALVRHLNRAKIESIVAVIKDEYGTKTPLGNEISKLGIRYHEFEAHGRLNFQAIKQLREFIKRKNIHILHAHFYKTDIIGLLSTIGTKCKTLTTPHGWSKNAGLKMAFYEAIDRVSMIFFDAVAPVSKKMASELKRFPVLRSKIQFIHNAVDLTEIDNTNTLAKEIRKLKENGNIIIGYIGQLIHRKGLSTLIKAAKLLTIDKVRICIIGEGECRQELEDLTKRLGMEKRIHFFGFRDDRIEFLRGFDVFVLPSLLEGIPRCVMEAMSAGVAVICSDIPGCRDLIQHETTGLLFKPESECDLVEQLKRIIVDSELRAVLSKNAKILIQEEYSAQAMAEKYQNLYYSLQR